MKHPQTRIEISEVRLRSVPVIVLGLRLGLFGLGLGGVSAVLIFRSIPNLLADPSFVLLLTAGLLTAASSALLVHDTLHPELASSRR